MLECTLRQQEGRCLKLRRVNLYNFKNSMKKFCYDYEYYSSSVNFQLNSNWLTLGKPCPHRRLKRFWQWVGTHILNSEEIWTFTGIHRRADLEDDSMIITKENSNDRAQSKTFKPNHLCVKQSIICRQKMCFWGKFA